MSRICFHIVRGTKTKTEISNKIPYSLILKSSHHTDKLATHSKATNDALPVSQVFPVFAPSQASKHLSNGVSLSR